MINTKYFEEDHQVTTFWYQLVEKNWNADKNPLLLHDLSILQSSKEYLLRYSALQHLQFSSTKYNWMQLIDNLVSINMQLKMDYQSLNPKKKQTM